MVEITSKRTSAGTNARFQVKLRMPQLWMFSCPPPLKILPHPRPGQSVSVSLPPSWSSSGPTMQKPGRRASALGLTLEFWIRFHWFLLARLAYGTPTATGATLRQNMNRQQRFCISRSSNVKLELRGILYSRRKPPCRRLEGSKGSFRGMRGLFLLLA